MRRRGGPVASYVSTEVRFHLQEAYFHLQNAREVPLQLLAVLDDFSLNDTQDDISFAAARMLGQQRMASLAGTAESGGLWWQAGLRWSLAGKIVPEDPATMASNYRASANAFGRAIPTTGLSSQDDIDTMNTRVVLQVLQAWDPDDIPVYKPRLATLLRSDVAARNPDVTYALILMAENYVS